MSPSILAALAGATLFHLLRVPAGALLGAMVAVAWLNVVVEASPPPSLIEFSALAAIGWGIGSGVTRETLNVLSANAAAIVVPAVLLLLFGGFLAWVLTSVGILDPMTAYLATAPGSISQIAAVSTSLNAQTEIIVAMHTVRIVAIILMAPAVAAFLRP